MRVVEPGSNYVVTQCAPALPAAVLDPLLGRLNASTDFAGFVKAVRAAFQALAAAGA